MGRSGLAAPSSSLQRVPCHAGRFGWYLIATGNTGIGLVLVANAKGYKTKFFVPDSTSSEKINVLRRLGAEVIICPSVSYDNPAHFQTVRVHSIVLERHSGILGG